MRPKGNRGNQYRPDIFKVRDLTTNKVSSIHTSRLRNFVQRRALSAVDLDEYYVEKIVAHEEKGKNPKNWSFKVRWGEYEPEEDSWLNWTAGKDLAALDTYSKEHPELKLG